MIWSYHDLVIVGKLCHPDPDKGQCDRECERSHVLQSSWCHQCGEEHFFTTITTIPTITTTTNHHLHLPPHHHHFHQHHRCVHHLLTNSHLTNNFIGGSWSEDVFFGQNGLLTNVAPGKQTSNQCKILRPGVSILGDFLELSPAHNPFSKPPALNLIWFDSRNNFVTLSTHSSMFRSIIKSESIPC